jgi:hypothetical protein
MATECYNRYHAATFPVELPAWFIKLFTEPGDIVLDPFMGSGTTAIACIRNDRRYIGIELVEEYVRSPKSVSPANRHRLTCIPLRRMGSRMSPDALQELVKQCLEAFYTRRINNLSGCD